MSNQVVIAAEIRPGKRDQLAHKLAQGPPFNLADHDFTRHQAFLGDRTVVFVFEGDGALQHVRDLAQALPMTELARMGMLIHPPQMLTDSFDWLAGEGTTPTGMVTTGSR
jgi:hypothetical protein